VSIQRIHFEVLLRNFPSKPWEPKILCGATLDSDPDSNFSHEAEDVNCPLCLEKLPDMLTRLEKEKEGWTK
jgi:hypothetical protein